MLEEKNKQKGFIQIPILIAIIVGVLVLGGGGYFGVKQYQNYQIKKIKEIEFSKQGQEKSDLEQQARDNEVEKLKQEVENLKNQKPQVIIKEVPQKSGPDLVSIISKWRPRIAHIGCKWYAADNSLLSSALGSGVLIPQVVNGNYVIVTNKHVIRDENGYLALRCDITFPDGDDTYTLVANLVNNHFEELSFDPNFDYGNIIMNNLTSYRKSIAGTFSTSDYRGCKSKASTGDQVVILGYPSIGSSTDITATEGIISGYENGYYVTSAKVEHGNSGGAAILVKDNCYLGIPSFAVSGDVESLSRILDLNYLSGIWSR